ncbi:hypothetical protein J6590_030689 [Homalodisca vitripennis]|nr:hypothetical protein J6590_030689 [Homalodisca vitripennis]
MSFTLYNWEKAQTLTDPNSKPRLPPGRTLHTVKFNNRNRYNKNFDQTGKQLTASNHCLPRTAVLLGNLIELFVAWVSLMSKRWKESNLKVLATDLLWNF